MELLNNSTEFDEQYFLTYRNVRQATLSLCESLEVEDYGLQAMPEVSPPKWHLAHTSWFFETFILKPFYTGYRVFHPDYEYLFNSYYHGVGKQYPRSLRGLLSRPAVTAVLEYREHVDRAMVALLRQIDHGERLIILQRCELGLNHEQQHQELLCTDIKYSFSFNPLYPSLQKTPLVSQKNISSPLDFKTFESQDVTIGHQGDDFHFDNEGPAHRFHVQAFSLSTRLITNAEYLEFMQDGGYSSPALWLADGWLWKQTNNTSQPLYWLQKDGEWYEYTLYGLQLLDPASPVSHVNYYEADACARWFDKRLPTEQEWELACRQLNASPGTDAINLHPRVAVDGSSMQQLFKHLWQWTRSSYDPYPGYRPASGAIGEYNGKFMCNQQVLRGSSCVTPTGHARTSYRNFFYPKDQWQFTGIRLANDL